MSKCPVCGVENAAGSKFCQFCGADMMPFPAAPTPPPAPGFIPPQEVFAPSASPVGAPAPNATLRTSSNGMVFYDYYGSATITALRVLMIVLCSLIAAAGVFMGVMVMIDWGDTEGILLGLALILGGAAAGFLYYFLLNIALIKYRNISLTGRNTEAQFHATRAQTESIEMLAQKVDAIALSVDRMQGIGGSEGLEVQLQLLENLVRQQALLSDLIRENTAAVRESTAAGNDAADRMIADAENEYRSSEDWRIRTESTVAACAQAIDALPERMSGVFEPFADRIAAAVAAIPAAPAAAPAAVFDFGDDEDDSEIESESKYKVVPKAVVKTAPRIVARAASEPEPEPEIEDEPAAELEAEAIPEPEPEIEVEVIPEPEPEIEVEPIPEPEPEAVPEPEPEVEDEPTPEPEPATKAPAGDVPLSMLIGPGGDL